MKIPPVHNSAGVSRLEKEDAQLGSSLILPRVAVHCAASQQSDCSIRGPLYTMVFSFASS